MTLPPWFASITHVPTAATLTVGPEIEHTEALPASTVKETGSPEDELAETEYAGPPTVAEAGADEVNSTVWECFTANDCCACGAAL